MSTKETKEGVMKRAIRGALVGSLITVLVLGTLAVTGLAEAKKDRFFTITLICPIGNEPREKAAQIIARDLEKIGIGVNLRYMEFASITPRYKMACKTGATFEEGGYDMYLVQSDLSANIDPAGIYRRFACDQVYPNGSNRTRYCNPEFDKIIYQALATPNDEERWALCREAMAILYNDLPTIPLWRPAQFYVVRSSVKFPPDLDLVYWQTYALRWAYRDIPGKTKEDMSLRERTLIYAQPSDIDAFLPGYSGSSYSDRGVYYLVYDRLIHRLYPSLSRGPEEERRPRPALAESWDVSEDGKTWIVHLRKDVTWHDGVPFTADDVVFTFNLITNPAAGYGSAKFIKENGITWEKLDDYTVKFTCEKFNPLFASEILDTPILPAHLLSTVPPEELARSEFNTGGKVVGTGPWILEEYKPGEYIKYRANDNYYGGRPWFDYVIIKFIPKAATAWYAVKTGEVDVAERWYGFTRELQEVEADPNLYALTEPSFGPQMIRINNDHPILSNVWVKRAISYACNRQAMVNVISNGLGLVANQHLPPWSPGHNPDLPPLEYDLNEAKKCLEKAGYDYSTITVEGPTG